LAVIGIGSNIASLKAQRRLSKNSDELSTVYERLSSGQRINKASDDAAGLSISESLKSDKRVFNQGVRNLNDGVSLLTIADSAVESLSNIVVRLKELAEQSANGVYSYSQRAAVDKEAQSLSKEYTRIAQSTKFNGVSLLNGSVSDVRIQAGYGTDGSILSNLGGAIGTGSFANSTGVSLSPGDAASGQSVIADFNNDGIMDIAAAYALDSANGGALGLALGLGNGQFGAVLTLGIFDALAGLGIAAGDFDNDGNIDLVGSGSTGSAQLYKGRGNGTFTTLTSFSMTSSSAFSLALEDLNGDGFLDLAALSATGVTLRLGAGNGTLGAASTISVAGATAFKISDINSDGNLDLLIGQSSSGGKVVVNFGTGNGTFNNTTTITMNAGLVSALSVNDINGDGILDIITAGRNAAVVGEVEYRFGVGDGTFGNVGSFTVSGTANVSQLALADINGDGVLDFMGAQLNNTVRTRLGNGDGSFAAEVSFASSLSSINVGDVNGDGVNDLLITGGVAYSGGPIGVRYGNTTTGASALLPFDLTTKNGAKAALTLFDNKMRQLSSQRGQIGAFQSRAQVAINVLTAASENYATAEGRIRDADIADESSKLTRLQILQQAATSVLAQANLQPKIALNLLKGGS
jgi:flagellin